MFCFVILIKLNSTFFEFECNINDYQKVVNILGDILGKTRREPFATLHSSPDVCSVTNWVTDAMGVSKTNTGIGGAVAHW